MLSPDSELPVAELAVPALPKLLAINGSAPAAGMRVDASGGLTLSLAARRRLARRAAPVRRDGGGQLRGARPTRRRSPSSPFRARCSPTCARPTPPRTRGGVGLSVEVARRVRVREPLVPPGARVSVEVRSTLAVELRP